MIFQTLDDKSECVGVYVDGRLYFDDLPKNLTTTWKYSGSLYDKEIEYVGLYAGGTDLHDCSPENLRDEIQDCQKKLRAYLKSFEIAKVNMNDHCIYDLIPLDFLKRFCEVKNKITQHVFETYQKPANYEHLCSVDKLIHKIRHQKLNLSTADCRHLLTNSRDRNKTAELIKHYNYIDYNLFGTVTGRLTTKKGSFPILTLKKELRQMIKPTNDLFVCLDYNGAEVRTMLELNGQPQPKEDIHSWNARHLFEQNLEREECKVRFFAWLYDPDSNDIKSSDYDRDNLLDKWYDGEYIKTPYGRKIKVERRKALNYLLQSTTSDRVLSKAVEIDKFLCENAKGSYISHIVHDEIVIDYSDVDRDLISKIKKIFEGEYVAKVSAGKDYYNLRELEL